MKRIWLAIGFIGTAACGDDAPGADASVARDGAAWDGGPVGPSADGAPLIAYEGTWAFREVLATTSSAPVVGVVANRAVTIGRATATPEGGGLRLVVETCALALETDNVMVTTSVLPGYPARIADIVSEARVQDGVFVATGEAQLQGCALGDPANEALPTSPTDPRVLDADEDGHPGMTVVATLTGVGEVQMYMVQRTRRDLVEGGFTGPDRAEGRVAIHQFEQVVLDATHEAFRTTPETAPDPAGSSFTLVRIDAATECAALVAQDEVELFGARPPRR